MAPLAYRKTVRFWESALKAMGPTWEEERARRRAHLERMDQPKLSGKEVAERLREERVTRSRELYDMADWYVYHGDRDVIRQVLTNRQFEVKITLPKEAGGITFSDYTVADGYNGPSWGSDFENLVWHQELHRYAQKKDTDPSSIFLLLGHGGLEPFKTEYYRLYYRPLLFRDDILAYLRIYANYSEWPTIRESCRRAISTYPSLWRDWSTINEALKIADERGPEEAYKLYMQRYRNNYQRRGGSVWDPKDARKYSECESVFTGWLSEDIRGETCVHDVNWDQAVMTIKNVDKIHSVLCDGQDITNLCRVTPENVMTIPVKRGKGIELHYRISVTPLWWEDYMSHNVDVERSTVQPGEVNDR
jgi:hypothetical protein